MSQSGTSRQRDSADLKRVLLILVLLPIVLVVGLTSCFSFTVQRTVEYRVKRVSSENGFDIDVVLGPTMDFSPVKWLHNVYYARDVDPYDMSFTLFHGEDVFGEIEVSTAVLTSESHEPVPLKTSIDTIGIRPVDRPTGEAWYVSFDLSSIGGGEVFLQSLGKSPVLTLEVQSIDSSGRMYFEDEIVVELARISELSGGWAFFD